MVSVDDLPDEVIVTIMILASLGTGKFEVASPASRFAHVSKKWFDLHQKAKKERLFKTKELRRVTRGMIVRTTPETTTGAGDVETIIDGWEPLPRIPSWWTSDYCFEGGHWRQGVDGGTDCGPFALLPGRSAPTLLIGFDRPATIRGVCFWARNKPRLVQCFIQPNTHIPAGNGVEMNMIRIPKTLPKKQGEAFCQWARRDPHGHARLVARAMPQGNPGLEKDFQRFDLPSILPEPLTVEPGECFGIRILASQERGWVGIDNVLLFE